MAEKKKEQTPPDNQQQATDQTASVQVTAEAKPKKLDETVPGGRYIVNGVLVDCNGKPIEDK